MTINNQSDIEKEIKNIIAKSLNEIGYLVIRVKCDQLKSKKLQIMIERNDLKKITVADCSKASKLVSHIFEEKDPIEGQYTLEVSSTGIDRPLMTLDDFIRFIGYKVKIITKEFIAKSKKFKGDIIRVDDHFVVIKILEKEHELAIDFAQIIEAKLIITEELLRS